MHVTVISTRHCRCTSSVHRITREYVEDAKLCIISIVRGGRGCTTRTQLGGGGSEMSPNMRPLLPCKRYVRRERVGGGCTTCTREKRGREIRPNMRRRFLSRELCLKREWGTGVEISAFVVTVTGQRMGACRGLAEITLQPQQQSRIHLH